MHLESFALGIHDGKVDKSVHNYDVFTAEKRRRWVNNPSWNWKDWQAYRQGYLSIVTG